MAPLEGGGDQTDELLTINIGPHHPATHGVLRLLTTLQGEVVRDVKPIIGYVHTGIEKSLEDQQYWKGITFIERMDYLAYYYNALTFCLSVERLAEVEVPPRAQWLRVIHLELNRIASHLFWLATAALDIGAITMLWWGLRERDYILDLFEMSGGQRLHTRYFQVGGVAEDIPPGFEQKVREFLEIMPRRIDQYEALLDRNEIWLQRMKGTGIVDRETLLGLGVTGPLLRAAGRALGPAQGDALLVLRAVRLQGAGRLGGRQLRPLQGAPHRDARVAEDPRAGARRHPRGPLDHDRPQGRAAAAPRARHLDGGAHPPLQARDRGLPGAAGRGLQRDRVPARRARLLRGGRRLGQARARAHARPELREPPGAPRHGQGRAARRHDRRAWRCSTRSWAAWTGERPRRDPRGAAPARLGRGGAARRAAADRARPGRRGGARGAARRDRGLHGPLPGAPLRRAARARRRPAGARLVLARRRSARWPR